MIGAKARKNNHKTFLCNIHVKNKKSVPWSVTLRLEVLGAQTESKPTRSKAQQTQESYWAHAKP